MQRRRSVLAVSLLVVPALGLGALGFAIVATAPAHPGAAGVGAAQHFAPRQLIGLTLGGLLFLGVVRIGTERLLRAAPALFIAALALTAAVFLPGVGVKAAGASRWLRLGPVSGNPAPFLIAAAGLLIAWSQTRASLPSLRPAPLPPSPRAATWVAIAATLLAVLLLVAEPDFSSAAVALAVAFAALAGSGVPGRRLVPAAVLLLLALGVGASRFGYVGGRIHGFLAPERDRRGKGFEVLQLARANASLSGGGVGLGRGVARRHLSSPASDYVYAVVGEELGRRGVYAVLAAWAAIGVGAGMALRRAGREPGPRGAVLAAGMGLLAPAVLHVAVSRGLLPIIGVSMPLLSYDPALTIVSGGELGLLAAVALRAGTDDRRV